MNQLKVCLVLVQYFSVLFSCAPSCYYWGGGGKNKEMANDEFLELVKLKMRSWKVKRCGLVLSSLHNP